MYTLLEDLENAKNLAELGQNDKMAELLDAARKRIRQLEHRDYEAGYYVEAIIAMRTSFTGDDQYVGWKGLGIALSEALDERDELRKTQTQKD